MYICIYTHIYMCVCDVYDAVLALSYKIYRTHMCDVIIPATEHLYSYDGYDNSYC